LLKAWPRNPLPLVQAARKVAPGKRYLNAAFFGRVCTQSQNQLKVATNGRPRLAGGRSTRFLTVIRPKEFVYA
jgi:hypothetical protein